VQLRDVSKVATAIAKGDLDLRIQELKAMVAANGREWKPLTQEQLQALLEDIINAEVMAQAASGARLDQSIEVQRRIAAIRRQLLTQEWAKSMQQKLSVSAEEIEAYFEKNKQNMREPAKAQVREIVLSNEEDAKQAMATLYGEANPDFGSLARRISAGPTADNGGLVDKWVMSRQDAAQVYQTLADAETAGVTVLDPVSENAVLSIAEVGRFSQYVKGADNQYRIFQLADLQEGKQLELAKVSDNIKAGLTIQKVQEAILGLKNSASIERFTDRLAEVAQ
jgi:hypothetical protein